VGAGLMTKSFVKLLQVDNGFRSDNLVAVMFTINTTRHQQYKQFYAEVIDRARTVPGVVAAGAVRDAPLRGSGENWNFAPPGMVLTAGQQAPDVNVNFISDGYLNAIGARMVAGREFTVEDRARSDFPVIVNETLAKRYFPNGDAVGSTLTLGSTQKAPIIGVVADIRQTTIDEAPRPAMYVNNMLQSRVKTTLVARTRGDPLAVARAIREAIWSLDHDQAMTSIFTFDESVSDAVARPRLLTVLLGAFGALGLVLGALGIYGVLAYLVSQRRREIGVRIALGAAPGAVSRMIVRRGLALTVGGVLLGVGGALVLMRFLVGVLYGIEPTDPLTFAGMTVVLLTVATLASWLPARRAAAVDPIEALRAD
jgi:predicted permease